MTLEEARRIMAEDAASDLPNVDPALALEAIAVVMRNHAQDDPRLLLPAQLCETAAMDFRLDEAWATDGLSDPPAPDPTP